MRKSCHNFEKALEHLERLKKISYGSLPSFVQESQLDDSQEEEQSVGEMKQALKNIESYLKKASTQPKSQANKALQESNFLIAGVQNVFSFLESRERELYQSLVHDYSELSKVYNKTQANLSHKIINENEVEEAVESELEELGEEEKFLNNLVEVKRDRSYELFYMSDEENKRFYTDTLTGIICKQGKLHETTHEGDPLTKTTLWNSEEVHQMASSLVFKNDMPIRIFYKKSLSHLDVEAVEKTHNAVMALFFSRYEATVISNSPKKNNLAYFNDFLFSLRGAWKALSNSAETESNYMPSYTLVSALSSGIFESNLVFTEAARYLYFHIHTTLTPEEDKKSLSSGQYITEVYEELYRLFSKYPNGPLFKAIDRILEPHSTVFDPIILGMLPGLEGTLKLGDKNIRIIRSPSPITQSSILYANCNEEFLGFLNAKAALKETTLILNIQNRLSRKDRARSRVIEESLERIEKAHIFSFPEPEELLKIIEKIHGEQETFFGFFAALKEEYSVSGSLSVFFIPKAVHEEVNEFLDNSLTVLKDTFFSKKKILFKNDKLLLLHIISYLLVFKLIEILDPNNLMVISKDGLDYVSVFIAGFAFFADDSWDEHRLKLLMVKILAPTLLGRDRLVFANHVEMLSKFVNCLRKNRQHLNNLKPFFSYDLEKWDFAGYLNEITEVSHKHNL
ncbi:calcium-binding protein [Chlamydia vaughanii]|uniref:calcium-binding protein n=1 Tax=Chlamydia vaughanii TaxID=3112552 RepID=UPI0032B20F22